jgi:uncharacterized protein (DUF488 family)
MLHRQRVLLQFLKEADRPVTRLELTKWSFLLRNELESAGGSAFYDFLPYRFGPFSFALFQELDKLAAMSFVHSEIDGPVVLGNAVSNSVVMPSAVKCDVNRVVARFGKLGRNRLIDYVYERYPAYTFNSEIRELSQRPKAKSKIFTAGYEGRSVDSFLNLLLQSGVRQLVDVRMNPIARRYGFHRSTLNHLCGKLDINYEHIPALGIRSDKRQDLDAPGARDRLFKDYEATTLKEESQSIDAVVDFVKKAPSVLVCMEVDPTCCHRSRLANVVAKRSGLPVEHLGYPHV